MIAFIVQYWLEVLFGLIAAGAGFAAKKFYDLWRKEQEHIKEDEENALKNSINQEVVDMIQDHKEKSYERHEELQKQVDNLKTELEILKDGILGIQGRNFKQDCRNLLKNDHNINLEEWETISIDHDIYNSLGGNHYGDGLYEDVKAKYHNSLK